MYSFGIIMDPIENIDMSKDSTIAIIESLQKIVGETVDKNKELKQEKKSNFKRKKFKKRKNFIKKKLN